MIGRERAVFGGVFGFFSAGAAAAVKEGVAGGLLEEGLAAVRPAALEHAQGAALADFSSGRPLRVLRDPPPRPHLRHRRLGGGAEQRE